jgi:hypothetical protein
MVAVIAARVANCITVTQLRETHSSIASETVAYLSLKPVALSVVATHTGSLSALYFVSSCGDNSEK